MSRYMIICRLRWPALLLLTGVIALLDQMDILSWGHAWPLYLILLGVLALAERTALAAEPMVPPMAPPPGYPYATAGYAPGTVAGYAPQPGPYAAPAAGPVTVPATVVPAHSDAEIQAEDAAREPRKSWEEEGR
jgi:hypothetical protein